ncbi:MAG: O-antigen ligase family protein, partial [Sideroxyarcus sp.]|nr:O-antigen ligase family protein [Sideroxyarcus sp.]
IAGLLLSAVAVFEHTRHWLLYAPLKDALGIRSKLVSYLGRGDSLRAVGSPGDAIVLGYVIAVAMGFFLYLKKSIPGGRIWTLGLVLLVAGLYSPLSRGPWLGAAIIVLVFVVTGRNKMRGIARLVLISVLALPLLMASPIGYKVRNYLPWVGTAETQTVDFRAQLLEQSISVIRKNPLFGSSNYLDDQAMQDLAIGSGFVDIVNTYVGIALSRGLVGLFLFLGVFVVVIYRLFKAMQRLADKNDEHYLLGQALLSVLVGILAMIGTVSSVSVIPVVYWFVAGLGVAYVRMTGPKTATVANPAEPEQPAGPNYIPGLSRR